MYRYSVFLVQLFLIVTFFSFGQTIKIKAFLAEKQFFSPVEGEFIEFQFQFSGYTFKYEPFENGLRGKLALSFEVSNADSIVHKDYYALYTPVMRDSIIDDFFEIKRLPLSSGDYKLKIKIEDLLDETRFVEAVKNFKVYDFTNEIVISDIQVNENVLKSEDPSNIFYKSGALMYPKLTTFFPQEEIKMPVYFEIYQLDKHQDSAYILNQKVINTDTGKEVPSFTSRSRVKSAQIVPILKLLNIENLSTGSYELQYSLSTRSNDTLAKKVYRFDRSNDLGDIVQEESVLVDPAFQQSISDDSVMFYLASLIPIAKQAENKNISKILKSHNDSIARKHIQAFWIATAGTNYYEQWIKYKAQVMYVEKMYSNNYMKGYQTDRGRVYLQYGAPSMVVQRDVSSTEYPYEIWQYNKIERFSNKRFIFYNPDLVTNGYRLLHSDMVGELKNNSWQYELNKRNTNTGTVDDPNQNVQPTYGGSANDYYRQY